MSWMPRFSALLLAATLWTSSAAAAQLRQAPNPAPPAPQAPGAPAAAAPQPAQPAPQAPFVNDETAERTRERLRVILRHYPPSVTDVLRIDSGVLLTNQATLNTYPELAAFLAQHPEIARNPSYFFGEYRSEWDAPNRRTSGAMNAVENMFITLAVLTGVITFMGLIGWAVKALIDHRRFLRMSKIQTEAHTKLLDRLTSNEDLLAYIQTRAGSRFLESAPLPVESQRPLSSPIGRILFSAQAGTVAMFAGIGLQYASQHLASSAEFDQAVGPFLFTVAVVVTMIGFGFLVSAGIAYALSRRLGLLDMNEAKASTNA